MRETLLGMTLAELTQVALSVGLQRYAARQIAQWLYVRRVHDIDEMTNLSKQAREQLKAAYVVGAEPPMYAMRSTDGTVKYLFGAGGANTVESVFIPDADRATLCVSSQVGCKMNCRFCMTGKQGFSADLTTNRILNQIFSLPEHDRLTNVVFMGMGEPMDNIDNVLKALEIITGDYGLGWSPKRITVSTVGIRKGLKRFLDESQCHLAVSMHSPMAAQRREWMPAERSYPIAELVEMLKGYDWSGQRRLSFEYIMFKDCNDSLTYAKEVTKLLRGLECRVNLIRFHALPPVDSTPSLRQAQDRLGSGTSSPPMDLRPTDMERMVWFRDYLTLHGVRATIRASRGEDILAACGMLSTDRERQQNEQKE